MAIAVTTSCLVSARGVMRRIPGICRTIVASADRYPRHGTITTAPLVLLLMRYACLRRGRQRTASLSTAAGTFASRCRRRPWSSHDAGGAEARRGAQWRCWPANTGLLLVTKSRFHLLPLNLCPSMHRSGKWITLRLSLLPSAEQRCRTCTMARLEVGHEVVRISSTGTTSKTTRTSEQAQALKKTPPPLRLPGTRQRPAGRPRWCNRTLQDVCMCAGHTTWVTQSRP